MTALLDAIRCHALERPEALAIDGGAHGVLDWRALADAVSREAERLTASMPPERPVGLLAEYGLGGCVADLALIEADLPSLPIPAFFTDAQRTHALAASGAAALLHVGSGVADIVTEWLEYPSVDLPDGTARISFTSGSTGTPKGICLSAAHLIEVAADVVDHVGAQHAGRHLALLPPGILLENVAGFFATMLAGGTYVALPAAETGLANPFRPDLSVMLRAILGHRITSLILVPELLGGIVAALEATGLRLPALTLVAVGGARIAPRLVERAAALGLPVRQGYGLTECGSVVCLETGAETERGSVGKPLGDNRIAIARDGEILIHGRKYLGTIGATASPGPLATGDIGRIDADGCLWIEGRKSSLIVTAHGRNIAPEWVESVLLAQPGIAQAMAHGEGEAELGALIVPAWPDAAIAAAIDAANATLPAYAQIGCWRAVPPFTAENGLLTGNGRLRRKAIAETHLQGEKDMPFFDRLVAETAAQRAAFAEVPQVRAGLAGTISRATYIAYLTQAYHHVRHTVPLMMAARARLPNRPDLVAALDEYIEEETGHEAWILSDITAAGGDGEAAAKSSPHPATVAMVEHAYRTIEEGNPAAFFGMVYVLEGTSTAMASQGADAVRASLGLPKNAFSYLTSHGALDLEHMRFFEDLMNLIDNPADQQAILAMARDMFGLFGAMFAAIPMEALDAAA